MKRYSGRRNSPICGFLRVFEPTPDLCMCGFPRAVSPRDAVRATTTAVASAGQQRDARNAARSATCWRRRSAPLAWRQRRSCSSCRRSFERSSDTLVRRIADGMPVSRLRQTRRSVLRRYNSILFSIYTQKTIIVQFIKKIFFLILFFILFTIYKNIFFN